MARYLTTLLIALSVLVTPAAASAAPDPCTLPFKPHWCES